MDLIDISFAGAGLAAVVVVVRVVNKERRDLSRKGEDLERAMQELKKVARDG